MPDRILMPLAARLSATVACVVCVGALALGAGSSTARASVTATAAQQLAAGLSDVHLGEFSVARDGTGALVYTASSGGVTHAYLIRLLGGVFSAPQQLDTGALGGASQPVVSADNGGQLLVAFISGGALYTEETPNAATGLSAPVLMATGASNPSIAMNLIGVGYLAYTARDGAGDDVDVDYWSGTGWAPASPQAMNADPGDDGGTGAGAPSVAAATDGVGIVAWGENGHVYSRRVWGTGTSVETEQDDPSTYAGLPEVSAQSPEVAVGGDSTYPDIVFSESFATGSGTQTRAMLTRLVAETTRPAVAIDGLSPGSGQDALAPDVAMGELGRGIATADSSAPTGTDSVAATVLGANGTPASPETQSAGDTGDPAAAAGVFGQISSGLAWDEQDAGSSQIELAYAADGIDLAPPVAVSSASAGPVQPADGLMTGGDTRGDAAVAWVQGTVDGSLAIEAAQLYTPEGTPNPTPATTEATSATPTLSWKAAPEDWGPVTYTVTVDGNPVATTTGTSVRVPDALTDGTYVWGVRATNVVGDPVSSPTGRLVVDTYAPRLRIRVSGSRRVRSLQRLLVSAADVPNPSEPGARASGIAAVTVRWGDRSRSSVLRGSRASHAYARPGLYTVTVTAADRAGNTTTLTDTIDVLP